MSQLSPKMVNEIGEINEAVSRGRRLSSIY